MPKISKRNITIIIRCSDDERLFRCLRSIDKRVEVVVSLTPNLKIENKIKKMGLKYCLTPKGNLSITTNAGLKLVKNKKFIVMDSDSFFKKGAVRQIDEALDKALVVKPKVIFLHRKSNPFSKLIAEGRDFEYSQKPKAYSPGLGLRKELKERVGGYFYHPHIRWTDDGDLNRRIEEAKIPVYYLPKAIIYHDPISLKKDLQSAFKYGVSTMEGLKTVGKTKSVNFPKYFGQVYQKKGFVVAVYMIFWRFLFLLGMLFEKRGNIFRTAG